MRHIVQLLSILCLCILLIQSAFCYSIEENAQEILPKLYVNCTHNNLSVCGTSLICSAKFNNTCAPCEHDSDCSPFYSANIHCKLFELHKTNQLPFNNASTHGGIVATSSNFFNNSTGAPVFYKLCRAKNLLPLSAHDLLASLFISIAAIFASATGIGGGGLFIPILLLLGRFTPQFSSPISTVIIFGTSIASFSLLCFQRHPTLKKPLIDYDVANMFSPIMLAGCMCGVYVNVMMPPWLLTFAMILCLVIAGVRILGKAVETWKRERKMEQVMENQEETSENSRNSNKMKKDAEEFSVSNKSIMEEDDAAEDDNKKQNEKNKTSKKEAKEKKQVQTVYDDEEEDNIYHIEEDDDDDDDFENNKTEEDGLLFVPKNQEMIASSDDDNAILLERIEFHEQESAQLPLYKWLIVFIPWVALLLSGVVMGGRGVSSIVRVTLCSPVYWTLFCVFMFFLFAYTVFIGCSLRRKHLKRIRLGIQYQEGAGEMVWESKSTVINTMLFFIAGIIAGMLGLGGGMIANPLLLEMGLPASVAMATSSYMILLTDSTASIQYAFMGAIKRDYGIWFFFIGLVSALFGQLLSMVIMKRFKKSSYLAFGVLLSFLQVQY